MNLCVNYCIIEDIIIKIVVLCILVVENEKIRLINKYSIKSGEKAK